MDRRVVDDSIRRCSTLVQALLAVTSLGLTSGTIVIWNRTTRGQIDFEGNQITRVLVVDTFLDGRAALDVLVNVRNARCRYLPLGSEIDWSGAPAAFDVAGLETTGQLPRLGGDLECGTVVVARAGFALRGVETPRSADDALLTCSTLLEALLAVGTMGVKDGTLEIMTADLTGMVEFHKRKVTRAVVTESGQAGEEALRTLMAVQGAKCTYLPLSPQSTDRRIVATKRGDTGEQAEPESMNDRFVSAYAEDAAGKNEALMRAQLRKSDQGVVEEFAQRKREEFLAHDPAYVEEPIKRSAELVNFEPARVEAAEDPDAIALARAGFVWDFHTVGSALDKNFNLSVPPSHEMVGYERITKTSLNLRKFVLPSAIVAICVLMFVGPMMLWSSDQTKEVQARQRQVEKMEDESYDAMGDGVAIMTGVPAAAVPAMTGPLQGGDTTGSATADDDDKDKGPDPADQTEFALADSMATLPRLEQLIYEYIAKKKYRRARDLACAGFRSPVATMQDRKRFYEIYKQCLAKQG